VLVIESYYSKLLKFLRFSTLDKDEFLVVLLLFLRFSIYHTFSVNSLNDNLLAKVDYRIKQI